jgi:hypothetical protein
LLYAEEYLGSKLIISVNFSIAESREPSSADFIPSTSKALIFCNKVGSKLSVGPKIIN